MDQPLTEGMVETIKLAARKLTGFKRREYLAEMTRKYCGGSARKAETLFGWGRDAVHTGLKERSTGIRCLDAFQTRGRKKTEERFPQLAREVRRMVEPHA